MVIHQETHTTNIYAQLHMLAVIYVTMLSTVWYEGEVLPAIR